MRDPIKEILDAYKYGVGFKVNDVLTPRNEKYCPWKFTNNEVVVLQTRILSPERYEVLGEDAEWEEGVHKPQSRFIKFEINGHDWRKVRSI